MPAVPEPNLPTLLPALMPALLPALLPVLALDTSTENIAAALHTGEASFTVLASGGAAASAQLLPQLRGLLDRAGLKLSDLRSIAFGMGPGAFTGLRTACAVAQGLGFGLGRPLLPLDSLLIVAEDARLQAGVTHTPWDIGVAVDARMDEAYAARFRWTGQDWKTLQAPALLTLEGLTQAWSALPEQALAGSALRAYGQRLLLPSQAPRFEQEHDRAAALLRLAHAAALTGPGINPAQALPLYLRDKVAQTTAERAATKAALAA